MAAYTSAQVQEALRRAGYQRTAGAGDLNAAKRFGLNVFGRSHTKVGAPPVAGGTNDPAGTTQPDITQQFIDQLRPLFAQPNQPKIAPFEGSGFYNEGDARSLANSEYDPYYRRLTEDTNRQNTADAYNRDQEMNAAGGFRSSAYLAEQERRRLALQRSGEAQTTEQRLAKEQFTQNRRNEAYQRYLQSAGAITNNV